MQMEKHLGVLNSTGSRVYVFWRELENEPDSCLYVFRDSLPDVYGDTIYRFVMGEGQKSIDLYEVAHTRGILDGRNMLSVLHNLGFLRKAKTKDIMMHVGGGQRIPLNLLNDELSKAKTDNVVVSAVPKDSPFDQFDLSDRQFGSAIVTELVKEATAYKQKYVELMTRAKSLDKSVEFELINTQKSYDISPTNSEDDNESFTFKIPKNLSQTKAIEMLKQFLKENK